MTTGSRRTILLHGGAYTASRFLNQGVAFLLLPLYAHLLGTDGVGVIEVLNVAKLFLAVLLAQGLEAAWYRFRFASEGEARRRFESTVVLYLALTAVVFVGALSLLGNRLTAMLTPGVPFYPMGFFTVVAAATLVFPALVERKFQGDQRPGAFAVWSLVRSVTMTGAVVFFVAVLGRGAAGKVQAEAILGVLLALTSVFLLRPALTASKADLGQALRYGVSITPHMLALIANDLADRFILNSLLGLSAVGVYSMGYKIAGLSMTTMVAVNQASSPVLLRGLTSAEEARKDDPARGEQIRAGVASAAFVNIVVACLVAQAVTGGAKEALLLVTTPAFRDSFLVVAPVCAGVLAWTWYGVMSQSVMFHAQTVRRLPLITLTAAALNVALNYVLVPRLGIQGAALATTASNVALCVAAYFVGRRYFPPFEYSRWFRVSAWTIASLVVLAWLDRSQEGLVQRVGVKTLWLAFSIPATLALSGIGRREIVSLFKRREDPGPPDVR